MTRQAAPVDALACEVCGRLPHPRRTRLALTKLAAVFPVELALHALVIHFHLSYLATVLVLAVSATIFVIWIVEPSATRWLGSWLHGPDLRTRHRLDHAPLLWRIRVQVPDEPGQLQSLATHLSHVHANILTVHVHHLESRVLDELVISTPAEVTAGELTAAATGANGSRVGVWPSSSLALIDGQTKALALAARATADPSELPLAVAELLGARYLPDPAPTESAADEASDPTVLHISAESGQVLRFVRADEPFTPAEIARANRINDLARIAGRR